MSYIAKGDFTYGGVNKASTAGATSYDNSQSGIPATSVQGAIDSLNEEIANLKIKKHPITVNQSVPANDSRSFNISELSNKIVFGCVAQGNVAGMINYRLDNSGTRLVINNNTSSAINVDTVFNIYYLDT